MGGEPSSIPSVDFFGRLSALEAKFIEHSSAIAELRSRSHDQANSLGRIEAAQNAAKREAQLMGEKVTGLAATIGTLAEAQKQIATDTAAVLSIITHSKSLYGFVRKQGPRLVAFGVGLALASGKISPEIASLIKSLFGA